MKQFTFIWFMAMALLACDPNNNNKLPPPQQVQMIEKLTDLGSVEKGIDAIPDRDGIYLEWYLLNDPDITQYNIYRKLKNEAVFSRIISIPVENVISPFDTTYSYVDDDSLVMNNTEYIYYYYVTATNRDGVEGAAPDSLTEQHYLLYSKPATENHPDINSNEQPLFIWRYQGGNIPNYYIVRIENAVTENLIWTRRFLNEGFELDRNLDLSTISNPPVFQSQSIYRWRIDTVGPDSLYSGSESNWRTFVVN